MRYIKRSTSTTDTENVKARELKRKYEELASDVPPARQLLAEKKARIDTYKSGC